MKETHGESAQTHIAFLDPTGTPVSDPVTICHSLFERCIYDRNTVLLAIKSGELKEFGYISNKVIQPAKLAHAVIEAANKKEILSEKSDALDHIYRSCIAYEFPIANPIFCLTDGYTYSFQELKAHLDTSNEKISPMNRQKIISDCLVEDPIAQHLLTQYRQGAGEKDIRIIFNRWQLPKEMKQIPESEFKHALSETKSSWDILYEKLSILPAVGFFFIIRETLLTLLTYNNTLQVEEGSNKYILRGIPFVIFFFHYVWESMVLYERFSGDLSRFQNNILLLLKRWRFAFFTGCSLYLFDAAQIIYNKKCDNKILVLCALIIYFSKIFSPLCAIKELFQSFHSLHRRNQLLAAGFIILTSAFVIDLDMPLQCPRWILPNLEIGYYPKFSTLDAPVILVSASHVFKKISRETLSCQSILSSRALQWVLIVAVAAFISSFIENGSISHAIFAAGIAGLTTQFGKAISNSLELAIPKNSETSLYRLKAQRLSISNADTLSESLGRIIS